MSYIVRLVFSLTSKRYHLYSLRKRALFLSFTISIIVLAVSIFGYSKLHETHEQGLTNIQERTMLLDMLNRIRVDILGSYKDLNNFLMIPGKTDYQENVKSYIHDAIKVSDELQHQFSVIRYQQENTAVQLKETLKQLESETNNLLNVRLNSSLLYPSLAVAAKYMRPNRSKMNDLLAVVMYEMEADNTIRTNAKAYETFISTRFLWNKVLSEFRIYLANKTGTFDASILPRQEKTISVTYERFKLSLKKLITMAENQTLGFESAYAVESMPSASEKWFEGFEKIRIIHKTDNWRLDARILKTKIEPKINEAVKQLTSLEKIITVSATNDINRFTRSNKSQNNLLWIVSTLGIIFIIFVVFSLDKYIFKPITLVISALKAEALGKKGEVVPSVNSLEAHDLVSAFSEMSRQVHARQAELEHLALHDSLTALPNRTLLLDRVEHDITSAKRDNHNLCLLIIDLDHFKEVNDTLGHTTGDNLLVEVGKRLKATLRDVDTVARFGGDEFAILLPNANIEQAKTISEKILSVLKEVFEMDDTQLYVTASIGVVSYPEHGKNAQALLRLADIAMYVAKRNKTGYEVYNPEVDEHSVARLELTNELRKAIEENSLDIYYQPVLDLSQNKVVGVEALCRWFHPSLGNIPPDKFIPIAEQAGLINDLTCWMLDHSIAQLTEWHKINSDLSVAVNISAYSFRNNNFVSNIRNMLDKYDYPHEKLILEITEGAMMEDPLQAMEVLAELQEMSINLAVDDFGTGYSSMAYLKKLPIDQLKIDKSFVIDLEKDKSNEAIVRSTIDLAHNLDLHVVAEGVESETVLNILKKYKCDVAQGYYMSKPVSPDIIEQQFLIH